MVRHTVDAHRMRKHATINSPLLRDPPGKTRFTPNLRSHIRPAAPRNQPGPPRVPELRARCEINFWRVLSANSPTEPPHRAKSARRGPLGCSAKSPCHG